jgi:DNA-binding MarR family transcriptional regulator
MPEAGNGTPADFVDDVRRQWAQIFPDVDTAPTAIIGRINRIAQIIQLRSDAVLAAAGLTRAEFDMLSLLARTGRPMTPTELAARLLISGAGATKRLKKLQGAGLIRRESNPQDGRGAFIHMTAKADELLRPILESVLDFEAGLLSGLPAATARNLARDLRTLLAGLEPMSGES